MSFHVPELLAIRDFLVIVAKEAGEIITSAKPSSADAITKKNTTDIVTATDKAVENLIATRLIARYPEYDFVGEESSFDASKGIGPGPTWVVDPIDGTSNFVHGLPEVCVSLALVVARVPVVGVVYNPFLQELFSAARGAGAYHQQPTRHGGEPQRLPLNNTPLAGLRHACVGIDFGSDRAGPNFALNLSVFATLAAAPASSSSSSFGGGGGGKGGRFAHSLRATNCASETVCRVAAGQQDCFWECGAWAWDVAAAWCVLTEAGGIMVDGHPGNWHPPIDNRRYLAVRPAEPASGQAELVEEFWDVIGEGRSTFGPPAGQDGPLA